VRIDRQVNGAAVRPVLVEAVGNAAIAAVDQAIGVQMIAAVTEVATGVPVVTGAWKALPKSISIN
jgi:hypothetical protein